MNLNLEKGNKLERAIGVIESEILRSNPNLKNNPFVIENKKIVIIDEVKHEIDWYVEIDLGNDYKSVYLFECKNWNEPINKNEIIVFSEKISVTQATKGFFVAKEFGKYAIAQAKKDPRIELLTVNDNLETLSSVESVTTSSTIIQKLHLFFDMGWAKRRKLGVDFVELNGEKIEVLKFGGDLGVQLMNERLNSVSTSDMADGEHLFEAEKAFYFESGHLIARGQMVKKVTLKITFVLLVKRLRILANFDVEKRGRIVEFEKFNLFSQKPEDSMFLHYNEGKLTFFL